MGCCSSTEKIPFVPYVPDKPEEISPPPDGPAFTITPTALPVRYAASGPASMKVGTLWELFKTAVAKQGDSVAMRVEKPGAPKDKEGEWVTWTYKEYYRDSLGFAKAMVANGHEEFKGVAICGFNHPAWLIAHVGTILARGLSAGTYTTNSAESCFFVADHCQAQFVVTDTIKNAEKYLSKKTELTQVKKIVVYLEEIPADMKTEHGDYIVTFNDFLKEGAEVADAEIDKRTSAADVGEAASLIYTSGTTGTPKAVMISHDNMQFMVQSMVQSSAAVQSLNCIHVVSFLPLSHIAAQVADFVCPIYFAAEGMEATVHFSRPDVLKGSLPITLRAARPTVFFAVPRVWEKIVESMKAKAKENPNTGLRKKIVDGAREAGKKNCYARQVGGDGVVTYPCKSQAVYQAVREQLGLDRAAICLTGAAPISVDTQDFLASVGIDVCELYGMSESTGLTVISSPERFKFGACGYRMKGVEVKIEHVEGRDKPGEGEICMRGRTIMLGYLHNEEKTREAIDPEGWLHSGDVGRFDDDGMLYITGRIKELIIGAGGENIAPVPIENSVKSFLPAISNAVMIGDKMRFMSMLITLKAKPNLETGELTDELFNEALEVEEGTTTVTKARESEAWKKYIQAGIDKYNAEAVSQAQKIQKFRILPTDLSVPGGELTATMKIKRTSVVEKYAEEIDAMYA